QNRQPGRIGLTLPDGRGRTYHISVAPGPFKTAPAPQAKGKGKGKGGRNKRKGGGAQARQVEALKESAKTSQDTPSSVASNEEASATRSRSTSRHKGEEILLKQVEELRDESQACRGLCSLFVVRGFEHQYQMVDDAQSSLTTHSKHSRSPSKGLQEVQGLQQDKADLEAKVSELEKDLTLYKDFKVCLEAKCDELQDEIKQQEERFKTDSEKLRSDVEDVEDLRKTQDAAHIARIVSLELSKESLQAKAQALEAEIARKDFEYGEFTTERDQLSKDKDAWVEEKKNLESRVEVLRARRVSSKSRPRHSRKRSRASRRNGTAFRPHVVELEKTKGELQSKVGGLEDDKSTILLKDQDDHTSQVLTLSAERDGLKEENITLKAMVRGRQRLGSVVGSRVGRLGRPAIWAPSEVGSTASKASKASSAVSKKSSKSGTKAPSQVGSLVSVKEEADADDDAATTVSDATVKPDDKTSEVSATPASGDSSAPDIIEVTESEAGEPAAEPEAAVEEAPSAETTADPEQAALLATLQTQNTELETRNATLQEKASKVETLTTERDGLASRLATAELDAAQLPTLREENGELATQLAETNAALESAMAAHAAANVEVDGLKAEVASLRSRLSSPSRRSGSTRTSRKDGDKAKQLVVVRDPNDRGQIQVIRRCDLRLHSRSASLSEGSGAD
ncbi:hypothetical protein EV126DRAFT_508773, partial [Verticillium dahliae]